MEARQGNRVKDLASRLLSLIDSSGERWPMAAIPFGSRSRDRCASVFHCALVSDAAPSRYYRFRECMRKRRFVSAGAIKVPLQVIAARCYAAKLMAVRAPTAVPVSWSKFPGLAFVHIAHLRCPTSECCILSYGMNAIRILRAQFSSLATRRNSPWTMGTAR